MDPTIKYYDENAVTFFENTKDADMKRIYELFLKYLSPGAKILDLGCGDELSFNQLLKNHPYFVLLEMKVTYDVRKGRENEKWLNVVLRKL
jgi:hypothetical protein